MTYGRDVIYLDHAATTPTDPAVVELMVPYFSSKFGNPSSIYQLGQETHAAVDRARNQVAEVLGCRASEVLFTSGATESNNLALRGVVSRWREQHSGKTPHLVISAIEHHAVLDVAKSLADMPVDLTLVPCDSAGLVDPTSVEGAIRDNTCLVSIMLANNEIGTVQPVAEIAAIARERNVPMHTDAVQAAGLLDISVDRLGVDLLSLSAHKFYGPKGVGILYVRKGTPITWQQHGGGQESGRRAGTENVPLIVGMGEAISRAATMRDQYWAHCAALRDHLWDLLQQHVSTILRNGSDDPVATLPNILNVVLPGVQGETMLLNLDLMGVAASAGSACTTGNSEPSHVLEAIGRDESQARATIRFSVGRGNSVDEVAQAAQAISESVARVRGLGSLMA